VALETLAVDNQIEFPLALKVLTEDRYIDDVVSGANSEEERRLQIEQTKGCLAKGGFTLKFVALSGEEPHPKASSDGKHIGILGLLWEPKEDTLSLELSEDFYVTRVGSRRTLPTFSLKDPDRSREALAGDFITRAGVLSRVAEMYDPCGLWEPLKLHMKLAMIPLNGLGWTDPVPKEVHSEWAAQFQNLDSCRKVRLKRCIIPEDHASPIEFRTIVMADAAADACGAAA